MVQPLWKSVWQFLKELNTELPCDPQIPLLHIYPEKLKMGTQADTCIPTLTAASPTTAKGANDPSAHQQMDKQKVVYTGTSLAVQGLRLHTPTAECTGSIPDQETKILHAARRGQKKKKVV